MSDNFISLVPRNVSKSEVSVIADKVIKWLCRQNIITDIRTDCVLGSDDGYPPGANFESVTDGNEDGLLSLQTNGLALLTEKQVFDNGSHGVEAVSCPNCGHNIIDMNWGDLINEWQNETGEDKIICQNCQSTNSIVDYKFDPAWAFGYLGFTFWNWPPFKESFIRDFETLTGKSMVIVYGRL